MEASSVRTAIVCLAATKDAMNLIKRPRYRKRVRKVVVFYIFSCFTYYSHVIYMMYQYRREKGTWDRLFDGSCVVFLETARGPRP